MREDDINIYISGRSFSAVMVCITIIASFVAFISGRIPALESNYGVCIPSSNIWISNALISWTINLICIIAIGILLITFNKRFNFLHGVTSIATTIFLLLELSIPSLSVQLFDGTMLCLVAVLTMAILFSTYQSPHLTPRIYLMFGIVSLCSLFQFAFAFLIPMLIWGMIEMHSFSIKGFIAATLGILTPFWILIGLGIIDLNDFVIPQIVNIFSDVAWRNITILILSIGFTILMGIVFWLASIFQLLKYKSQIRACNEYIGSLMLATIIMIGVDYKNILTYVPLLNYCVAICIAHFFITNSYKRRYIIFFLIVAIYITLYVWRIII